MLSYKQNEKEIVNIHSHIQENIKSVLEQCIVNKEKQNEKHKSQLKETGKGAGYNFWRKNRTNDEEEKTNQTECNTNIFYMYS